MTTLIRIAIVADADRLTQIAFAAKRSWNYPEEYLRRWKDELTITEAYIRENVVWLAEYKQRTIGFYSIVAVPDDQKAAGVLIKKGYWMDHLFIDPEFQHQGIGKLLVLHALDYCKDNWIDELNVFVDPNATGFYEKMGAKFVENSSSSIAGRELPVYSFQIETD